MTWHDLSVKEVLKKVRGSVSGLSSGEAMRRLSVYGKNEIKDAGKKSRLRMFFAQFNSLLIYILIAAAVVSALIGQAIDAFVIFVIVILNAGIGFAQEYKAEEIIEKLKRRLDYDVLVLRDHKQKQVSSRFIVPGDIIFLKEGDKVLADCRVLSSENLQINEAILTGESFPVGKDGKVLDSNTILAERKNLLYAGTMVVRGKAMAVVVSTGMETEFGKLAGLVQKTEDEKMPLQEKVDDFSKKISFVILGLIAVVFFVGIYLGLDKLEMFLIAVSLAVGAIPEGLPAIIVITLAVAIKQMYKVKTLVRKLPAAETLGRATVICTDKTGTLTEEQLSVDKIYSGRFYKKKDKLDVNLRQILKIGILCNNAREESDEILGDPTETTLIKAAKDFGFDKKKETERNPRVREFEFTSERKMMSIVRSSGRINTSYIKGAPGLILPRCSKELVDGKIKLIDEKRREELKEILIKMEGDGLRVLGFAFRQIAGPVSQSQAENHLIFAGFMGMIDPPRKEVKDAIREAIEAGIKIKIITGDAALTTKAIAEKIGLSSKDGAGEPKGEVIEGRDLERLSDEQWDRVVREKIIFARTTPKQKLRIINILKKQNHTVAVTGDGVNDILALKSADIGIAMGLRGADVARDSSDMVLLDDNFASIIYAVREGRRVFDNLKKSIKFLLAANAADIFIILFALMIGLPLPFLPLAILWMNLVTDSLPALALAFEPAEAGVMKERPKKDGLLQGIWHWILIAGVLNFIIVIYIFNWGLLYYGLNVARTMAITSGIMFEMFFVFACKSENSIFKTGLLNNKYLIYAVLISIGLQVIVVYTRLGGLFGFVPLTLGQLGMAVGFGLIGLVVFEGWKLIKRK